MAAMTMMAVVVAALVARYSEKEYFNIFLLWYEVQL